MNLKDYDNLTQVDPFLGERKEVKQIAYDHFGWLKNMKKTNLPKLYRPMLHFLGEGNLLMICSLNERLIFYNYNTINNKISELISFNLAESFQVSAEFIHHQSFLLNSKYIYLIKNSFPNDTEHIYLFDMSLKRLDPIKNDGTRPTAFRINYTVNIYDYKMIFFGGLDFNLNPLNHIEAFNLLTYKWEKIDTKGKFPEPRHSHSSFLVGHNLYILGGTKSQDPFSIHDMFDDFFMLNLNSLTWTPIKMYGSPPRTLCFNYSYQLSEKYIVFLSCESIEKDEQENLIQVHRFDSTHFEWEKMQSLSSQIEFRFGAGCCFDNINAIGYLFGGLFLSKIESQCLSNEMEKIKFGINRDVFDDLELVNTEKTSLESPSKIKEEPKPEKDTSPNEGTKNMSSFY